MLSIGQQAALSGYARAFELAAATCLLAFAASLAVPEIRRRAYLAALRYRPGHPGSSAVARWRGVLAHVGVTALKDWQRNCDQADVLMHSSVIHRATFSGYGGCKPRTMCWKPASIASAIASRVLLGWS